MAASELLLGTPFGSWSADKARRIGHEHLPTFLDEVHNLEPFQRPNHPQIAPHRSCKTCVYLDHCK